MSKRSKTSCWTKNTSSRFWSHSTTSPPNWSTTGGKKLTWTVKSGRCILTPRPWQCQPIILRKARTSLTLQTSTFYWWPRLCNTQAVLVFRTCAKTWEHSNKCKTSKTRNTPITKDTTPNYSTSFATYWCRRPRSRISNTWMTWRANC